MSSGVHCLSPPEHTGSMVYHNLPKEMAERAYDQFFRAPTQIPDPLDPPSPRLIASASPLLALPAATGSGSGSTPSRGPGSSQRLSTPAPPKEFGASEIQTPPGMAAAGLRQGLGQMLGRSIPVEHPNPKPYLRKYGAALGGAEEAHWEHPEWSRSLGGVPLWRNPILRQHSATSSGASTPAAGSSPRVPLVGFRAFAPAGGHGQSPLQPHQQGMEEQDQDQQAKEELEERGEHGAIQLGPVADPVSLYEVDDADVVELSHK